MVVMDGAGRSLAAKTWFDDYTPMRGLVMDLGHDEKVRDIGDQYLFGPALLINPVTEYRARERAVYLPQGSSWYDFYTGRKQAGGQTITAEADYGRMPIYVRAGAILPVGPAIQYTNEKPESELLLYIYAGADGAFTLYDDEAVNNAYEKGAYATIELTYDDAAGELTIGETKGDFPGRLTERTFRIVYVTEQNAVPFDADHPGRQSVTYSGTAVKVDLR